VVVVDAAHGGDDGGAQLAGSTAEKTVTLALNVRLRSLLSARGVQVVTTREDNSTMDGDARAQVANHAAAAACISLHATEAGTGVHIFVSSLEPAPAGSGAQPRFFAWKTAQAAFVTRSLKLASMVNSALEQSSGKGGDTDSGGGPAGGKIPITLARTPLPGVDSMACPAVAIEVAPLRDSDHKIATEVTDARYQAQIAEALAAAVLEWRTDLETGAKQP
jgi:N-acetylmuramoyl-L-alanine amidase